MLSAWVQSPNLVSVGKMWVQVETVLARISYAVAICKDDVESKMTLRKAQHSFIDVKPTHCTDLPSIRWWALSHMTPCLLQQQWGAQSQRPGRKVLGLGKGKKNLNIFFLNRSNLLIFFLFIFEKMAGALLLGSIWFVRYCYPWGFSE